MRFPRRSRDKHNLGFRNRFGAGPSTQQPSQSRKPCIRHKTLPHSLVWGLDALCFGYAFLWCPNKSSLACSQPRTTRTSFSSSSASRETPPPCTRRACRSSRRQRRSHTLLLVSGGSRTSESWLTARTGRAWSALNPSWFSWAHTRTQWPCGWPCIPSRTCPIPCTVPA